MTPEEILDEIAQQTRVCTRCPLHLSRKNAVPGEGNPHSRIMFIGEGPGFYENEQGRPFVGAAGNFLEELLSDAGFKREEVFITNVVKCRPPGNRDPEPEELNACKFYLERQISAINPDVIVTLGRVSMNYFIDKGKISLIHGRDFWSHGRMVVAMYHPAAALHQPSLRTVVKKDFAKLPILMTKAQAARQTSAEDQDVTPDLPGDDPAGNDQPEQLSLF